jgi:drug/metabolite transporter (DMT)-like permease
MTAIVLAVAAAVGWGASDYFGGDASRHRTPVFVVVALAEVFGFVLLLPALLVRASLPPDDPRLVLAAVAGVAVTVELSLIYRAIAQGNAFLTAPVGALGAAIAVTIGLLNGDPLDLAVASGLVCALLGAVVSTWTSPDPHARPRSGRDLWRQVGICLGAAAAVGTMLTCLHTAGRLDPTWATATEHASTAMSAGAAALVGRHGSVRALLPRRADLPVLVLVATVGVGGDLAYATASHAALSIVSAISSLYPVTTIGLAALLRRQRPTRVQLAGATLALVGAALLGATAG